MPEPQNLDGIRIEKLSASTPAPETAQWDGKVAKKFEGYDNASYSNMHKGPLGQQVVRVCVDQK